MKYFDDELGDWVYLAEDDEHLDNDWFWLSLRDLLGE